MAAILRRDDRWLIGLAAITLAAWGLLAALGADGIAAPALCSSTFAGASGPTASLDLFLALNPPGKLGVDWMLMLAAMTPPLLVAPLRHLRQQGLPRHGGLTVLAFVAGYVTVWMAAGVALQALSMALHLMERPGSPVLGLAIAIALLWQVSPTKQRCLNRCHDRPHPAAPGLEATAEGDAFTFGVSHGAWCVGACWALMLPPLLIAGDHLLAMAAVTLFLFVERLERPATPRWSLRAPGKALYIALTQAHALDRGHSLPALEEPQP